MQEDNEFRFQELEGEARRAPPPTRRREATRPAVQRTAASDGDRTGE